MNHYLSKVVSSIPLPLLGTLFASPACQSELAPPGQLVVSIETDMALPDQLDNIRVQVLVQGQALRDLDYSVGAHASDIRIPATLTVVAGHDPALPVTIRVAGSKAGRFRTLREATTTVPHDRVAHLRMPLQWLCDESANDSQPAGFDRVVRSTCDDGYTCRAGHCVPVDVKPANLSDFSARRVFGGAEQPQDGRCFDTLACMITGETLEPDKDCTLSLADQTHLNVALRVPGGGICDDSGTICFVPLDGFSDEGWQPTGDGERVTLPSEACNRLADGRVSAVYASHRCAVKTAADPPCGNWSSVTTSAPPVSPEGAEPTLEVSLIAQLRAEAEGAICCPLLSDGESLYTCACPNSTEANLYSIAKEHDGTTSLAATLPAPSGRKQQWFAAALAHEELYWTDTYAVEHMKLTGSALERTPVDASIYHDSPLLADESSLFAQANRIDDSEGSPVQVLRIDFNGMTTVFDTGGNSPVYQFGQTDDALFLAVNVDEGETGARVVRDSTLVRVAKRDGKRTHLAPAQRVETSSVQRSGYLGVQADGDSVYALFETTTGPDGTSHIQLHEVETSGASAERTPHVVYDVEIDPTRTQFTLLGVLEGTTIVSRIELEVAMNDELPVRSASIIGIARTGGAPRILADLTQDYPLQGLVADDQHVYVLTSRGAIYGIGRAGLP